jgi:hypothetical protein
MSRQRPVLTWAFLSQPDHEPDGVRETLPFRQFLLELCRTGFRQLIKLCLPAGFCLTPPGGNPSLLLEAVERRIESALGDLKSFIADLFNPFRDGPAMLGLGRYRLQDQEIECALDEIRRPAHSGTPK